MTSPATHYDGSGNSLTGNCCTLLLHQDQKARFRHRNRALTWVELRGFEPLTPSMPLGYSRPAGQAIR